MNEEYLVISIRIGNSYDWNNITPGRTYDFKVNRNTFIKELKQNLCEEFHEPEEKNIIQKYNIYNNRIILLNENNIVKDAFKNPNDSELDLIDKNETVFYALVL
uniref:Ubiquitin-like domain-containing protein n=1 Tax=viral metagenome TaxID=1070528 RepID=A0A6C0FAP3_9ZZZZ|tara:strand:+ start:131 stop:442 length:312 start_codon:yes stop_codon:yes gene_type:complete